ncbi:MAG: rRNA pseudouridine synthase [Planctomycetes bacterium]|nr:rRNA pseudouridine synthase [Planctomycetota bacterium]
MKERLQKVLARAGLGSRRYCETLIAAGRVQVDGAPAAGPGARVDPGLEQVEVDGRPILLQQPVYYLLNKPRGCSCAGGARRGERSAAGLVRAEDGARLFSAGRLDQDAEGALILTNDGEFSNLVTHPRYALPKTYRVKVRGRAESGLLARVRARLSPGEKDGGATRVQVVKRSRLASLLHVTLCEGRSRRLRCALARLGLPVLEIARIRIGSITLDGMKPGAYRRLAAAEVEALREEARAGAAPLGARPLPGRS